MSKEDLPTSIYVIGPQDGPYKIGFSQDCQARLSNIQTGQAVTMNLFYQEETSQEKAKVIEKLIHRQLAHKRVRGEWFAVDLEEAIAEVKYAMIRWEGEDSLPFRFKNRLL